ncbi:MAG: purine-nucleoside phosphorylase [Spirochaetes bacterium]|uniref:Purine nucleoside phosphorylase n=1 Tax=Candidatus Ornithospirochaeta stercoripullorum TaxID=2840899 RepID=A0A9D9DWU2_9SPIO|nr:purine-nucleoside phosphorylase [Candidatus Ornithospirochaeta stercoripullorum]
MELMEKLNASRDYIASKLDGRKPVIGLILGSGLGDLADELHDAVIIDYHDIPYFPVSTVEGHKGRLVIGELEGKTVLCMQGRFHYYEGYSMDEVVYPVRTMKMLGINGLFLTNAAGCVNTEWKPGDLMLISDHIKLIADNPLRGKNPDELGLRFFDMTQAYDKDLLAMAEKAACDIGIAVRKGIYMLFTGPSFETPAEVRFARLAGADAVGMSTVPEAIAASHMRMHTVGISCMTNMAAGILDQPLNHVEVLETGERVKKTFSALVKEIVKRWPQDKL